MNRPAKKLLLTMLLFLAGFSSFSADLAFYLSPRYSFRNSTSKESLYYGGTFGSDPSQLASLLVWNEKAVMTYGLDLKAELTASPKTAFIFSALADFTIPYNSAWMSDSDWTTSGIKFNYSKFDCTIANDSLSDRLKNFSFRTSFACKKSLGTFIDLIPGTGFFYSSAYYKAKNGYGWYGSSSWTSDGKTHEWNSSYSHYFPDGKYHLAGINYYVRTAAFFTGLTLQKNIGPFYTIHAGFNLYPFTFVLAKDRHLGSKDYYDFADYLYNYFKSWDFSAGISARLSSSLSLNLNFNYYTFLNTRA
uniref:hypothetical protein n=1 Tax=Treponema sp. TaxID=166 RepID=UPI0025F3E79F